MKSALKPTVAGPSARTGRSFHKIRCCRSLHSLHIVVYSSLCLALPLVTGASDRVPRVRQYHIRGYPEYLFIGRPNSTFATRRSNRIHRIRAAVVPDKMSDYVESYSLWVMPSGEQAERLQSEIDMLAAAQNGPHFEPHVTVLPDIKRPREEVVAICEKLASQLKVSCRIRCAYNPRSHVARCIII